MHVQTIYIWTQYYSDNIHTSITTKKPDKILSNQHMNLISSLRSHHGVKYSKLDVKFKLSYIYCIHP